MSERLGYTFYPKDFSSDPEVMMMTPSERGIYRDLIDLAYLNNNAIKYSFVQLAKYTNSTEQEVEEVLLKKGKKVGNNWTIPSCNKRIAKAMANRENGKRGGRPKKTKQNPTYNPTETQTERQRESEEENEEEKEKRTYIEFLKNDNLTIYEQMLMNLRLSDEDKFLEFFENKCVLEDVPFEIQKIKARWNILSANWKKEEKTKPINYNY